MCQQAVPAAWKMCMYLCTCICKNVSEARRWSSAHAYVRVYRRTKIECRRTPDTVTDFLEEGGRRKGTLVFAKRVEGRHSREFIHTLGVVGKQRFLVDLGVNFFPVGTLEAPGRPWVTRSWPKLILDGF